MWIRGSKPPSNNKNGFAIFLGAVAVGLKGGLVAPGAVGEPRRGTKKANQDSEPRRGTKTGYQDGEPRRGTKTGNKDGEQRRGTKTGPKIVRK